MESRLILKNVAGHYLAVCIAGVFLSAVALAQSTLVLISNYDVKLTVAGELHHITSQVKVRDRRTFPIEFQQHRIDVSISNIGNGEYRAILDMFERTDAGWNKITTDELAFEAQFAAPIQYKWTAGDVSVDLGIAVSMFHR